jgi:hypothetical protein
MGPQWLSSKVCWSRQLKIALHQLGSSLPIYDAETGKRIDEDLDTRVELLRDTLLDEARERVDQLGEVREHTEAHTYTHTRRGYFPSRSSLRSVSISRPMSGGALVGADVLLGTINV